MSAITAQFAKTAHDAVSRIGELLRAQVFIVDRQNTVVASSEPTQVGLPFRLDDSKSANHLQVPVQIDSQLGWAIVGITGEEIISPRLAGVLVELVVQQLTVGDRLPNRQALKNRFIYDLLHQSSTQSSQASELNSDDATYLLQRRYANGRGSGADRLGTPPPTSPNLWEATPRPEEVRQFLQGESQGAGGGIHFPSLKAPSKTGLPHRRQAQGNARAGGVGRGESQAAPLRGDGFKQAQASDEANVLDRAKLLGLNLIPPRAVILIDAADYILMPNDSERDAQDRQHRRAQLVIGSIVNFFHLPDDTICAHLGAGKIAVLKASNTKNMGKWAEDSHVSEPSISSWANLAALKRASRALLLRLRSDTGTAISIGIGRYHPGIKGLSRSYQDARAALALGRRSGHNQIFCLDCLGIAAFVGVADEQTKVELAIHLLSPLDCEPELLTTLEVFFSQDCCPSTTAKQLLIHRNTLSYRLDKVTSLTGLNPRRFDDAVQIRLALLLRSL